MLISTFHSALACGTPQLFKESHCLQPSSTDCFPGANPPADAQQYNKDLGSPKSNEVSALLKNDDFMQRLKSMVVEELNAIVESKIAANQQGFLKNVAGKLQLLLSIL